MKRSIILTGILFVSVHLFATQALSLDSLSPTKIPIVIHPNQRQQKFEGWGGSLCWWANMLGKYPDSRIKLICDWLTDPDIGLNMNIFRFNIGGGDNPTHNHMRTDGGAMPGYKASATTPYNWKQDSCQRKVLKQLIASRISKVGVNDLKLVAFSNSPPWWMTSSECTSGNTTGTACNLRYDMYSTFADYLTDVVRYYHDTLGITFQSIEPFNEPFSNWWIANNANGQEGCYFSQINQQNLIRTVYTKLSEKNMLSWCSVVAMDANSIDEGFDGLTNYKNAGDIVPKLSRLNVHSYAGSKRKELATLAASCNLPVWQSASGPQWMTGSTDQQILSMAERLVTDMRDLKCTAWLDWQLVALESNPQWGFLLSTYSISSTYISKSPAYYIRSQFDRYLKKDYSLISNSSEKAVSAISPDNKKLVVLLCNVDTIKRTYYVDLSEFSYWDKATQIQTQLPVSLECLNRTTLLSNSENGFYVVALPGSVTTLLIPINQTTDIQEASTASMQCFNREILLDFPGVDDCEISVYNAFGQCVAHYLHADANGKTTLDVQDGFYVVKCKAGNRLLTQKILVKR